MSKLTIQETHVLAYFEGTAAGYISAGSFTRTLIKAISLSDKENRAKLHQGFPEYVEAVTSYQQGPASPWHKQGEPTILDKAGIR